MHFTTYFKVKFKKVKPVSSEKKKKSRQSKNKKNFLKTLLQ